MAANMENLTRTEMLHGFLTDKENLLSEVTNLGTSGRQPLKPVQENVLSCRLSIDTPTERSNIKKILSSQTRLAMNAKRKSKRLSSRSSIPVYGFRRSLKDSTRIRSPVLSTTKEINTDTNEEVGLKRVEVRSQVAVDQSGAATKVGQLMGCDGLSVRVFFKRLNGTNKMAANMENLTRTEMLHGFLTDKENLLSEVTNLGTPGRQPLKPVQENVLSCRLSIDTPTERSNIKKILSCLTPLAMNTKRKSKRLSSRSSIPVYGFRRSLKHSTRIRSPVLSTTKEINTDTNEEVGLKRVEVRSQVAVQQVAVDQSGGATKEDQLMGCDGLSVRDLNGDDKELDSFSERVVTEVLRDIAKGDQDQKENKNRIQEFTDIILQMNKERLKMERQISQSRKILTAQKNPNKNVKTGDRKLNDQLEKDLSKKKSEIQKLRSELSQVQGDRKSKYMCLEREVEGKKVEIKQLKVEVNQLQHKLHEVPVLKTELLKAKEQTKGLNDILFSCRKENNSQKTQIEKLRKDLNIKEIRIKQHLQENEKQIKGINKELKEKEMKIQQLKESLKIKEKECSLNRDQQEPIGGLVSRLEIVATLAEEYKESAKHRVEDLIKSLGEKTEQCVGLEENLNESRSTTLNYQQQCEELTEQIKHLKSQVDVGKLEISRQQGVISLNETELEKKRVELCMHQEYLELVQCQQQQMNEFVLEEKRSLEDTAREMEQELRIVHKRKSVLDVSLREASTRCDELEEEVKLSRSLFKEKQEELDATQCQAHCIMLQQQTEMTDAQEELGEAWEILESLLERFTEESGVTVEAMPNGDNPDGGKEEFVISQELESTLPPAFGSSSFVQSVLAAVEKGKEIPPLDGTECSADCSNIDEGESVPSLCQQVDYLKQGLLCLAEIGSGQAASQQAQETIMELKECRDAREKEMKTQLKKVVGDLEISRTNETRLKSDLSRKTTEMQNLMNALREAREHLETNFKEMDIMNAQYSRQLDLDQELQLLREDLQRRSVEQRHMVSEKDCLAQQLQETLRRVDQLCAGDASDTLAQDVPSKLLQEKFTMERKLKQFKEKFMDYRLRTDDNMSEFKCRTNNKIYVLERNLEKAESEICRLDEILEKIKIILHKHYTVINNVPELTKLVLFLDGDEADH